VAGRQGQVALLVMQLIVKAIRARGLVVAIHKMERTSIRIVVAMKATQIAQEAAVVAADANELEVVAFNIILSFIV